MRRMLVVMVCLLGLPSAPLADDNFAKNGVYIAAIGVNSGINGDFKGDSALGNPNGEVLLVPSYRSAFGLGAALGTQSGGNSFELNFARSSHDVTFGDAKGTATYNAISLDYRRSFFLRSRLQPHLLIGWIPVAWTSIKDASGDGSQVGDGTFWSVALGANLGAGLTLYPVDRLFISASAGYRFILFTSASGVSGDRLPLEDKLNGSAPYFIGRTGFIF